MLKQLRDSIDFVRPMLPPGTVKSYLQDCKKLQQTLGDMNDDMAATALTEQLVDGTRFDLIPAVGALSE